MHTSDAAGYHTRLCSLDGSNGRGAERCRDEVRNEAERMGGERQRDGVPIEKVLAFSEEKFCSHTARLGGHSATNARSYWN